MTLEALHAPAVCLYGQFTPLTRRREVALVGESRGRLFGLLRHDLWLPISPFASAPELVTS